MAACQNVSRESSCVTQWRLATEYDPFTNSRLRTVTGFSESTIQFELTAFDGERDAKSVGLLVVMRQDAPLGKSATAAVIVK
jgi:hypothetical protein